MSGKVKGLLERLNDGEMVLVAEGYLFEFERRGYLKAGAYVPEVVLEHPDVVSQVHEEFAHAGSDVTLAFTYYGHRIKMRLIGREDELEKQNRMALKIARQAADKTGTLMAGNICNTTIYDPADPEVISEITAMNKEQLQWAKEGGADFIVAETYPFFGEAKLALECMKEVCPELPKVVTLSANNTDAMIDGVPVAEACRKLEELGADVVGLNCIRGPESILPLIRKVRKACKGHIACLPVPYRTTDKQRTFQSIPSHDGKSMAFPDELDAWMCRRATMREFAATCKEIGVNYIGMCCGGHSAYMREIAEGVGRKPAASRFQTDISQHWTWGKGRTDNLPQNELLRLAYKPSTVP